MWTIGLHLSAKVRCLDRWHELPPPLCPTKLQPVPAEGSRTAHHKTHHPNSSTHFSLARTQQSSAFYCLPPSTTPPPRTRNTSTACLWKTEFCSVPFRTTRPCCCPPSMDPNEQPPPPQPALPDAPDQETMEKVCILLADLGDLPSW